jgi:hypothetical protein
VAAIGKQRAGKNTRFQVAATNLRAATWRIAWRGDDLDTTNFESGGEEQGTIGTTVREWTVGGDWDAAVNAYDNPPGLYPRDDLGAIKAWEHYAEGPFHYIPANRVLSAENGAEVKGKVTFTASGKSQGGGSAAPTGNV